MRQSKKTALIDEIVQFIAESRDDHCFTVRDLASRTNQPQARVRRAARAAASVGLISMKTRQRHDQHDGSARLGGAPIMMIRKYLVFAKPGIF